MAIPKPRPIPAPAPARQHPCRCPVCGGDQFHLVSEESTIRDVSEDTFTITPLGRQVLEELNRQERESAAWARYHGYLNGRWPA